MLGNKISINNHLYVHELEPGDILHLKVNTGLTSNHFVRPIIYFAQKNLSGISKMTKEDTDQRLIRHESDIDFRKDLNRTGHQTIYVGYGKVVEVTGKGVEKRYLKDIDSASYIVVRPINKNVANSIKNIAEALSERNFPTLAALLKREAPEILKDTIDKIDSLSKSSLCKANHYYDNQSAFKGLYEEELNYLEYNPLEEMIKFQSGKLSMGFVCSSFAALVIDIAEKQCKIKKLTVKTKPKYVTPIKLDFYLREKELDKEYETKGWFHNLGSSCNKDKFGSKMSDPKKYSSALKLLENDEIKKKINAPDGQLEFGNFELYKKAFKESRTNLKDQNYSESLGCIGDENLKNLRTSYKQAVKDFNLSLNGTIKNFHENSEKVVKNFLSNLGERYDTGSNENINSNLEECYDTGSDENISSNELNKKSHIRKMRFKENPFSK